MKISIYRYILCLLTLLFSVKLVVSQSQINTLSEVEIINYQDVTKEKLVSRKSLVESIYSNYYNQDNGLSLKDLVNLAWENNSELKIAKLEVEKAQAKLKQAGLPPNPRLEIENKTGQFTGAKGDNELTLGVIVPLEIYGQRGNRINVAKSELLLKEAEINARKRLLASHILMDYAEALAALRELKTIEEILELDTETVRFVQIRVNEGETAPLELSLLQNEVERLRSRRDLTEGKLQNAITKLKFYAGIDFAQTIKLREEITSTQLPETPILIEIAFAEALKNRPEIQLSQIEQQLAQNGLRLIRSQSKPEISAFTRYTQGKSVVDSPRGAFEQSDKLFTFGLSIGLPIFNRNQGAKTEAEINLRQTEERKIFAEQIVKKEVITAFQRLQAANKALIRLETSVIPRAKQNVEVFKQVYAIGEFKITDLISEQRRLLEANNDLIFTLTEQFRAKADLLIALGISVAK